MAPRLCFPAVFVCTTALLFSQENPARLSVAAPSPSPAPVTSSPATSNPQPATTALPATQASPATNSPATNLSPEGSNLTDAPLPEVANQPKVIPPGQTQTAEGPKGPRDGHWYVAGGAGAMLQQIISGGTATIVGTPPLDQGDSNRAGVYAAGKVGYDFAVRDVQLAFGGPTPMRTAMELEFAYLGSKENIPLQSSGTNVGRETYNLSAYSVMLNGLVKFEDLVVTPYFGGGVGAAVLYANRHQIVVNGYTTPAQEPYNATSSLENANNVCLTLQAIVGIERRLVEGLSVYLEYKFMAYMDPQLVYGKNVFVSGDLDLPPPGSNSSANFMAQQILSGGLKWSF